MVRKVQKQGRLKKSTDRDYQFQICLWIALGKDTKAIQELLQDRFNITMSHQNINTNYKYAKRWRKIISYLRERYLRNISRIPIARKEYRLAIMQETLEEALTWRTKSVSEWGRVEEKKIGIIPALMAEARAEVEGNFDKYKHMEVKVSLLQIIKEAANGNGRVDIRTKTEVDRDIPLTADTLDKQNTGDIEIL